MSFGGNTKGFTDTKKFRKCVLEKSNERLGLIVKSLSDGENGTFIPKDRGMLGLLDSSYKSDVPSTNYAMHLKSIAFESARFLCITEQVTDDIIFENTRGEYISQNIASFLFPGQRFSQTNSTDEKVRNFYLSIIEAYFGGSTRSNIESSLLRFLSVPVGIIENFLLAREDPTIDSIINKFTFDITIQVDDPRIKDINQLQKDIEFLLNIIKPAHTTYTTKFIFSELFDIFRKGCILIRDDEGNPVITHDGFETNLKVANTSICEVFHIDTHDYFYEDLRKPCQGDNFVKIEDEVVQEESLSGDIRQASPRWAVSVTGGTWSSSDPAMFHTRFGPFGKEDGSLASTVSDIQVYVDGIRAEVIEIHPLSAAFKLRDLPPDNALIKVSYYYLKKYIGALITNDFDSVINNYGGQATELDYKTVLFPSGYSIEQQIPLEKSYRYKGFNLFNTSILNDAFTLNMNELGLRNRMNDYDVFKSHGYDQNLYVTTLADGQELIPRSLEKKDTWRRLPYQEFRMNNNEFVMNNSEDRMYGEIHYESYHPFYSALEYDVINNGGTSGLVQSICEDAKEGMQINFQRILEEDFTYFGAENTIQKDYSCQFFTFPTIPSLYSGSVPAKYSELNNNECTLQGGNGTWVLDHPLADVPEYHLGGTHSTMRLMIDNFMEDNCSDMVDELWEILWNRDPSENPVYSSPMLASENPNNPSVSGGNSEDRGYVLHTFQDTFAYPNSQLNPVVPIHIDDVSRENLNELEDSDVDTTYVKLTDYIPLMLNGYSFTDLQAMDPSINAFGVIVASINNNPPTNSPLLFLTPRKILNGRVTSVYNETSSIYYNLTNMVIINNQVIDLDENLNPSGLSNGDVVRVIYEGVDYTNEYDQMVSIYDPDNFILFSKVDVSLVYDIFNYTKGFAYDLTGSSYIESDKLIHLDPTVGMNSSIGLDLGDIVFAKYITVNNEENPAPVLNQSNNNFVITSIEVAPV